MRYLFKKTTALVLALILALSLAVPSFAVVEKNEEGGYTLRFNEDGSFKILIFADCQDGIIPNGRMTRFMADALDREQPDLVIFLGDNVLQEFQPFNEAGIQQILRPLVERGVPYAYVWGNHDGEYNTKENMHAIYCAYGDCLTYDADPALTGFGNFNMPIYASYKRGEMVFNICLIDSNMYLNGDKSQGYDYVHPDQLAWYRRTSEAIEAQQGHKVPSLMFQHIIVPEIYELLKQAPADAEGENICEYNGQKYYLEFRDDADAQGLLLESPSPSSVNGGLLEALVERGDVLAVFSGHDHTNRFRARVDGIELIQCSAMAFMARNDERSRGYHTVTLNEAAPQDYTFETTLYTEMYPNETIIDQSLAYFEGAGWGVAYVFKCLVQYILDTLRPLMEILTAVSA